MNQGYEIRSFQDDINIDRESRHITGYALVFNSQSRDLGGYTEVIERSALTEDILLHSDIIALFNHDMNRGPLARSRNGKGTLTLTIDDHGLRYDFEAPHTTLGDELIEYISRGDIYGSSFGFQIEDGELTRSADGQFVYVIRKFKQLFDISPVIRPAYEQTEVMRRSIEDAKNTILTEEEQQQLREEKTQQETEQVKEEPQVAQEQPQQKEDLSGYFSDLRSKLI